MSRKIMNRFRLGPVSISLLAALTAASAQANAQEQTDPTPPASSEAAPAPTTGDAQVAPQVVAPPPAPSEGNKPAPERITVTGSRIRQIELEGPKPIVTVRSEEIKKSGATNVNEYLEKLTLASFGTASYGGSYGAAEGTQGFSLRGLGEGNTLILLNGRRLVRDPYLEFVDLSVIPTAAVERIDILKGTASAIYGTDAAAGVVNIITRKDFDGFAFGYTKTKQRYNGGGDHDQAYTIAGTSSEKSSNIITFQWDEQQSMKIGNKPWVDRDYRSIYGYPFSYYNAEGGFTPGGACDQTKSGGQFCSYSYMDEYQLAAPAQKISVLDDFTYNLGKNTKLGVRLFATKKSVHAWALKTAVDESSDGYMVSQAAVQAQHPELDPTAQYLPNDARAGALGTYVHGRLIGVGAGKTQTDQLTYSGSASIIHDFDGGQNLEVTFSESRVERNHAWLNRWDATRLSDAIWDGSLDVFANPAQTELSQYRVDTVDRDKSIARSIEATYTGDFEWASRTFGYAVGASQIRESYLMEASPNKVNELLKDLGGGGGSGERKANALFAEVKAPLVSTLELSVAGRYDDYTDFGDTFNPAVGLQYRIGKEWFFRGNYGTGFKAPTLRNVYDSPATYYTTANDYLKCNQANASGNADDITTYCENEQGGSIVQGGNRDLDPETSQTFTLFVGFEPVQGYGVNLEYFNTHIEDMIGNVTADDLTKLEADGTPLPTGTEIIRGGPNNDITGFLSPTTNLATLRSSGLETNAYASQEFAFGTLSFKTNYSYYLNYEQQDLPDGPYVQQLEKSGLPRWRWNNSFGYGVGIHDVALISRSNGRYKMGNEAYGYIGSYTSWDLNYGIEAAKNISLNFGGENVFNQVHPQDKSDNIFRGNGGLFYNLPTYYMKADFRI